MTKLGKNLNLVGECNRTVSWNECSNGIHHFLISKCSLLQKKTTFRVMMLPPGGNWGELNYTSEFRIHLLHFVLTMP